jgi:hypothetical protein
VQDAVTAAQRLDAQCRGRLPAVGAALAIRAFMEGFAVGADGNRSRRRHAVDPSTHPFWRQGHEAGRDAHRAAVEQVRREVGEFWAEQGAEPSP